jgi:8-oxo-dGTP pyrophosphatase MutT (NUDIX family)
MKTLAIIGQPDASIQYGDRPTVKVVVKKGNDILLLNKGLLPGGGVDEEESDKDAVVRELQEELGSTVKDLREIGTVIQYRDLLIKKYIINGYAATLDSTGGITSPQDDGEAQFVMRWSNVEDAKKLVEQSIEEAKLLPMNDDAHQGRLYNLMTTYELLSALE